jgi:hypothetical protein
MGMLDKMSKPVVNLQTIEIEDSYIADKLNKLALGQDSEYELSEISDMVAGWLVNIIDESNDEYQTFFASYIQNIPQKSAQTLIGAFSDNGLVNVKEDLLVSVGTFLTSTDKGLAQTAAIFLLTCGDRSRGRHLLSKIMSTQELPHLLFIKGIIRMLSGVRNYWDA